MKPANTAARVLMSLFFFSAVVCTAAETPKSPLSISGTINLDDRYSVIISGLPANAAGGRSFVELPISKTGTFSWQSTLEEPRLVHFSIIPKARDRQLATDFPAYLQPGSRIQLNLHYSDTTLLSLLSGNLDNNNRALFQYSRFSNLKARELYKNPPATEHLKTSISAYIDSVRHLVSRLNIKNEKIRQYLDIWAFNNYQDALFNMPGRRGRNADKNKEALPDDFYSLPGSIPEIYDNELSLLFNSSMQHINRYLSGLNQQPGRNPNQLESLSSRIDALHSTFTCEAVKEWVILSNFNNFIRRYTLKDSLQFEQDVAAFRKIAKNIRAEPRRMGIIADFENLRFTRKGASLPDITFKDAAGQEVKLQRFAGNYIYIDLWASWCVPCIKEIPHLQQLENDYKNKNIVFVSISIDSDRNDWINKLKELKLHGNQLETGSSGFEKLMNVSGIPHFLLYGPDGKLVMYQAPRPSSKEIRTVLDAL